MLKPNCELQKDPKYSAMNLRDSESDDLCFLQKIKSIIVWGCQYDANTATRWECENSLQCVLTGATTEESRENLLAWLDAFAVGINLQRGFVFDENHHRVPGLSRLA